MEEFIPQIAAAIGISPSQLVFYIIMTSTACNVIARVIPDDATGPLGVIRKIASVIGVQVSNKISPGVTLNTVARAALDEPTIQEKVEEVKSALASRARETETAVAPATRLVDAAVLHRGGTVAAVTQKNGDTLFPGKLGIPDEDAIARALDELDRETVGNDPFNIPGDALSFPPGKDK